MMLQICAADADALDGYQMSSDCAGASWWTALHAALQVAKIQDTMLYEMPNRRLNTE